MFELNLKKNAKFQKESNGGTKLNKIIKQFPRVNKQTFLLLESKYFAYIKTYKS